MLNFYLAIVIWCLGSFSIKEGRFFVFLSVVPRNLEMGRIILRVLISCHFLLVNCDYTVPNFFSVVGPKTLRIDEPYKVAVSNHITNRNVSVTVGIVGASYDGREFEVFDEVDVGPGDTETRKFFVSSCRKFGIFFQQFWFSQLPHLSPGLFFLHATSQKFSKSVPLYLNSQQLAILIQVSKPIYRPDSLMKFRVFVLDSRTRPYEAKYMHRIWILDPSSNRVKIWEDPEIDQGVFQGKFLLSDASEGSWKILVEIDGEVRLSFPFLFCKSKEPTLLVRLEIFRSSARHSSDLRSTSRSAKVSRLSWRFY